jgi:hypothetical protein
MLACIGILIDAYEAGKLVDDRPTEAPMAQTIAKLEPVVKHLKNLHKDKTPKHWVRGTL